ncbi:MAG: aminotransferase class I/II-fold pyridoxal phosphate-dependent enzyme, partial [Candidatus Dormibacteria bacterium]
PFRLPDEMVAAMAAACAEANRYPPPGRELVLRLAERHRLPPEEVGVAGGSLELLRDLLLAYAGPGTSVVYGWRSYEAYPILVGSTGARPVPVPLVDQRIDLAGIAREISPDTTVVLLADPNNPTGTSLDPAEVEAFARGLPPTCLLVLDQAYCEFGDPEAASRALNLRSELPNLVVLRTFSKAFALAGMRVGWCTAHPEVVATLEAVAIPFTLTAPAQAGALAALGLEEELRRRAQLLVAEREQLTASLRKAGFQVPTSRANFLWLPLGQRSSEFALACSGAGVSVRCFPGEGVRVTVGLPEENQAVLEAAAAYLRGDQSN